MTAPHYRSYEPIEGILIDGAFRDDLVVTAELGGTDAPFNLTVNNGPTLHLTAVQVDTLIAQLQRARVDVLRGSDAGEEQDDG